MVFILSCGTSKTTVAQKSKSEKEMAAAVSDTVTIANEELEYEIIIIEPGFNVWLQSRARPQGYYSQSFLENRNRLFVLEWNARVLQPQRFNPNLYQLQIDYQPNIDYGYEVNYLLYYYFVYFQMTYGQQLTGFIPRI